MTEPAYLTATRSSYDTVAESYAEQVPGRFAQDSLGRGMLAAFAELIGASGDGGRPVADLGCGPGHVTDYLASLGLAAFGIDLSPKQVEVARRTYPRLRFEVGSMTALELADGAVAGVVSWWSIVHTPPEVLPVVFAEFYRVLAPGGRAIVGFHAGDLRRTPERAYGHAVTFDSYRHPPERVAESLAGAGLPVTARLTIAGEPPAACLLATKPEPPHREGAPGTDNTSSPPR